MLTSNSCSHSYTLSTVFAGALKATGKPWGETVDVCTAAVTAVNNLTDIKATLSFIVHEFAKFRRSFGGSLAPSIHFPTEIVTLTNHVGQIAQRICIPIRTADRGGSLEVANPAYTHRAKTGIFTGTFSISVSASTSSDTVEPIAAVFLHNLDLASFKMTDVLKGEEKQKFHDMMLRANNNPQLPIPHMLYGKGKGTVGPYLMLMHNFEGSDNRSKLLDDLYHKPVRLFFSSS
jgi:hypothetical protein